MPRGGARVGAGRKPKDGALAALHGHRARRLVEPPPPAADEAPPEHVDPPQTLLGPALEVWQALAPHARAERTLTSKTAAAFELLCRAVVIERELGASERDRGGSNHRGMMQRVEAGFSRFRLAPTGKAAPPPKPVDPFAEFAAPPSTPQ